MRIDFKYMLFVRGKKIALFTRVELLICSSVSHTILGADREITLSVVDIELYLAIDVIGKEIRPGIMQMVV